MRRSIWLLFLFPLQFLSMIAPINHLLYVACTDPAPNLHLTHQIGRGHAQHLEWHPKDDLILVSTVRGAWLYDDQLNDVAHIPQARLATFSPNGNLIAGVDSMQRITLWNTFSRQNIDCLTTNQSTVTALAWSPDNMHIASASQDGLVMVWNARRHEIEHQWQLDQPITKLRWNPSGTYLAAVSEDTAIQVFELESNDSILKADSTTCCDFDYFGMIGNFDVGWVGKFRLVRFVYTEVIYSYSWDVVKNTSLASSADRLNFDVFGWVSHASPNGRFWANSRWSFQSNIEISETAKPYAVSIDLAGHVWGTMHLDWSNDNRKLISSGYFGEIIIWDIHLNQQIAVNNAHSQTTPFPPDHGYYYGNPNFAGLPAWSSDQTKIAVPNFATGVEIWDLTTDMVAVTLPMAGQRIASIKWNPRYDLIATAPTNGFLGIDRNVRIWDTDGNLLDSYVGSSTINWHPSGQFLSLGNGTTLYQWNVETRQLKNLFDLASLVNSDIVGSLQGIEWNQSGEKMVVHFPAGIGTTTAGISFPSNESPCDGGGRCGYSMDGHDSVLTVDRWSPDGSRWLEASWWRGWLTDETPYYIDLSILYSEGDFSFNVPSLVGHTGMIQNVIWSPSADHLISISADNTARLWDVNIGLTLHVFPNITEAYWSPDATKLALFDDITNEWHIVDTLTFQTLLMIPQPSFSTGYIVWSPDAKQLAHILDGVTFIWQL